MIWFRDTPILVSQKGRAVNDKIRILIVDDHPVVRYGLKMLLEAEDDMKVVGTLECGQDVLTLLEHDEVDLMLLDLRMPRFSGLDTLQALSVKPGAPKAIILTSYECDEEIYAAVKYGAKGYVQKEAPSEVILEAIRKVYQGFDYFPLTIANRLSGTNKSFGLSAREIQILELIAKGLTNKEASTILGISQFTIRNHLSRITHKMDVSDRTEAIFRAIETGIIKVH